MQCMWVWIMAGAINGAEARSCVALDLGHAMHANIGDHGNYMGMNVENYGGELNVQVHDVKYLWGRPLHFEFMGCIACHLDVRQTVEGLGTERYEWSANRTWTSRWQACRSDDASQGEGLDSTEGEKDMELLDGRIFIFIYFLIYILIYAVCLKRDAAGGTREGADVIDPSNAGRTRGSLPPPARQTAARQPRRKLVRLCKVARRKRARRRWRRNDPQKQFWSAADWALKAKALIAGSKKVACRWHGTNGTCTEQCCCNGSRRECIGDADSMVVHHRYPRLRVRGARPPRIGRWWWMILTLALAVGNSLGADVPMRHPRADPHRRIGSYNMLWKTDRRREFEHVAQHRTGTWPENIAREEGNETERNTLSLITANIFALEGRMEEISDWDADVLALQETKLTAADIKDIYGVANKSGWTFVHGKPCEPAKGGANKKRRCTYAAQAANSGGVALLVKHPRRPIAPTLAASDEWLHGTGRWQRIRIPVSHGARCLKVSSVYGISGANDDRRKHKQNEAILAAAVRDAVECGDDPCLLCGDINVNPLDSPAVAQAVDEGLLIDVGYLWATRQEQNQDGEWVRKPEPTFAQGTPPVQGVDGPGVSRIDVILANPAAAAMIVDFKPRWDLIQVDHVPLQVKLDVARMEDYEVRQKGCDQIDAQDLPEEWHADWDAAVAEAEAMYAPRLNQALADGDVDQAHITWNRMAEACIYLAKGEKGEEVFRRIEGAPPRGGVPRFIKMKRCKYVDALGHPTTYRQRQVTNAKNLLVELRSRLKNYTRGGSQLTMWDEKKLECGDTDYEEVVWLKARNKVSKIMGANYLKEATNGISEDDGGYLEMKMVEKIIGDLGNLHSDIADKRRRTRRSERRAVARWDWRANHGRRAFAQSRLNYQPPTYAIEDPDDPTRHTAAVEVIHDEFMKCWREMFCSHGEENSENDRWGQFKAKYGKYIPKAPFEDRPYEVADYISQLERMRNSAAGFDGWKRDALRALPEEIWRWRARVDNLAKDQGIVPIAYLHAPMVMLPKGQGRTAEQHRGIIISSMLHRVCYGALWDRLKYWQEAWMKSDQHGGRIGGEHLADAWDIQAQIEASVIDGVPLSGAALDYAKFFDYFAPRLIAGLMIESGLPDGVAAQMQYIASGLRRYVKVAGTYGAVIDQANGAAQGCTMSVVVANLYVATLFNYLSDRFPGADLSAFLDDRNVTATSARELISIIAATTEFDNLAGHKTNVDKSIAFATEAGDRRLLQDARFGGKAIKVQQSAVVVGHEIKVNGVKGAAFLNERAAQARDRVDKVQKVTGTRKQKKQLVKQALIPSIVSGTMWQLLATKTLEGLRNAITKVIWGVGRALRCKEVLLSVLNDPTEVDPVAAIVFKRLDDARRLLLKSERRMNIAYHIHEASTNNGEEEEDDQRRYCLGPVKGMRQVAGFMGGILRTSDRGFHIEFGDERPDLWVTNPSRSDWKEKAKEAIRISIARQLTKRLVDPSIPRETRRGRGERKDMYGINGAIDHYATTVNLRGRAAGVVRRNKPLWERVKGPGDLNKYSEEGEEQVACQRLQAIIAGSIRCYDRLFAAKLVGSKKCKWCQHECGNVEHLAWDCPHWAEKRKPYKDLIEGYRQRLVEGGNEDARRLEAFDHHLKLPCLRNCGIMPESTYFVRGGAPLPKESSGFCRKNCPYDQLTPREKDGMKFDEKGRAMAFTDGSAIYPTDPRRRRAAWAVYHGTLDHAWAASGPVTTPLQTSFRGELQAVLHAMTSASMRTCVISDCYAVVELVRGELQRKKCQVKGDHADLWEKCVRWSATELMRTPITSTSNGSTHISLRALRKTWRPRADSQQPTSGEMLVPMPPRPRRCNSMK